MPRPPRNNDRFYHDLAGVTLVAVGGIGLVSTIALTKSGQIGQVLNTAFRIGFGVGCYEVPLLLAFVGVVLILGRSPTDRREWIGGVLSLWVVFLSWWHFGHTTPDNQLRPENISAYGGYLGAEIAAFMRHIVGVASPIVYFAIGVASVVWLTDMRLLHILAGVFQGLCKAAQPLAGRINALRGNRMPSISQFTWRKSSSDPQTARRPLQVTDDVTEMKTVPSLPMRLAKKASSFKEDPAQPSLALDRLGDGRDSINQNYQLPPVDLLSPAPPPPKRFEAAIAEKKAVLMRTMNEFKIGANVQQVSVGPTVTRYEVQLEPGILVKKIVALADNLAMSLAAIDVRVEAPIPGKAAIGIEVPNEVAQMVCLRECLEIGEFVNAPSKLTFALGKDVAGQYKYADLARMPHLLIGGSTNSGKSVCLNALICSILYRATPRDVRFVMIDPKRVELSLYDGIPHLLAPVIKDTKQAAGILRSVLKEMEHRYDQFAKAGTRNIDGYNGKMAPSERLPYIVVVIDELADLMMTQGPEVETSICRLAQLARATGIHLVIATQRPSVDVITGTIKANISSRIAFAVATQVDSRTIIDMNGADRLIGRGDMLFLPIDASKPLRVQGCYVSEAETDKLVKYLKDQEEPRYGMLPIDGPSGFSMDNDDDPDDELFEATVRWLVGVGTASTSSLQRKFKIGYTRAARLIETMEARGIVGSQDGVKPREVLLTPGELESYFVGHASGVLD